MAIGKDGRVVRQLRTLFHTGVVGALTDGQLLERFAMSRGEAAERAFAVLLERHGPMVLAVCRSVLADAHAAEDAFQATFLVLVKRARSLWVRESLGPWLHQVAYRTALCARSAAVRRRRLERRAAAAAAAQAGKDDPSLATNSDGCCTRRSSGSPSVTRRHWSCATSRDGPTSKPRGTWGGPSERSRAGSHAGGSNSATGSADAGWTPAPG